MNGRRIGAFLLLLALLPEALASSDVHAFFYLWYGNPQHDGQFLHWNHSVLPHWTPTITAQYPELSWRPEANDPHSRFLPKRGFYSSRDVANTRDQFWSMKQAGIGVAVISWWGRPEVAEARDSQGVSTDSLVPMLLDAAAETGVEIAFHMEPYPGRTAESVSEDLRYLADRYFRHQAVHRQPRTRLRTTKDDSVSNKPLPLVYVYDSYHIAASDWAGLFGPGGSIRGAGSDVAAVGLVLEQRDVASLAAGGFDAGYSYFSATGFSPASTLGRWPQFASACREAGISFLPSVGPGYDDAKIRPWNTRNTRPRENGQYYRRMWQAALELQPPVVTITSYNEWGEGTQVEEAVSGSVAEAGAVSDDLRRQLHAPRHMPGYETMDAGGRVIEDPALYLTITKEFEAKLRSQRVETEHESRLDDL